ncbi:MAG: tetratricopeptide repeat protein [Thermoanaerobaculaceae bacterium]
MRKLLLLLLGSLWATGAAAAVFERFLNPARPEDRAILNYLELERQGRAQSNDLAELAVLLVKKGFPKDAEDYLRKALKMEKGNVEARYRLGLVLQRLGQDRAAAREYRRVIKARPGFAEAQFMLALALERCGRRRAAVAAYVKAYKHDPRLADPAVNPLVLDSKLQTQARLLHYRQMVTQATLNLKPLDEEALRRMMLAKRSSPPPPSESKQTPPLPQESMQKPGGSAVSQETSQPPLQQLFTVSRPLRVKR